MTIHGIIVTVIAVPPVLHIADVVPKFMKYSPTMTISINSKVYQGRFFFIQVLNRKVNCRDYKKP